MEVGADRGGFGACFGRGGRGVEAVRRAGEGVRTLEVGEELERCVGNKGREFQALRSSPSLMEVKGVDSKPKAVGVLVGDQEGFRIVFSFGFSASGTTAAGMAAGGAGPPGGPPASALRLSCLVGACFAIACASAVA